MKRIFTCLVYLAFCIGGISTAFAQNHYEEVIPFGMAGHRIVIPVTIGEKEYPFLLDLRPEASTGIIQEYAALSGAAVLPERMSYPVNGISATGKTTLNRIGIGEHIFVPQAEVFVLADAYLSSLPVAGVAGKELFEGKIVTIDTREKTLTVSAPYKPAYMSLRNRLLMKTSNCIPLTAGTVQTEASLDLQVDDLLVLPAAENLSGTPGKVTLARTELPERSIRFHPELPAPVLGAGLLALGAVTFDYTKNHFYFEPWDTLVKPEISAPETVTSEPGRITSLDGVAFRSVVFDYRAGTEWKYEGETPCLIDFWAEWCGPCKRLEPVLDELAREFAGKLTFYKVNIDEEKETAEHFGIRAIPLLWLIVPGKPPHAIPGVRSAGQLREIIRSQLQDQ